MFKYKEKMAFTYTIHSDYSPLQKIQHETKYGR